ncbi:RecX family protein [Moraxella catarrhalis BC1]|nr:RecX family protein [Moraxella catarrhalis BC1]
MGESPVSADNHQIQALDETNFYQLTTTKPPKLNRLPKNNTLKKPSQPKSLVTASSHDTAPISHTPTDKTQPPKALKNQKPKSLSKSQIGELLKHAQGGQDSIAMPKKLADSLSDVAIEPLIQTDKATNYLRWLAFYYLSRREMSQHELQKNCLPKAANLKRWRICYKNLLTKAINQMNALL